MTVELLVISSADLAVKRHSKFTTNLKINNRKKQIRLKY